MASTGAGRRLFSSLSDLENAESASEQRRHILTLPTERNTFAWPVHFHFNRKRLFPNSTIMELCVVFVGLDKRQ